MSFRVAQKTLESLEWPRIVERLRATCRTPRARKPLSLSLAQPEDGDQSEADEQGAGSFEFAQSLERVVVG